MLTCSSCGSTISNMCSNRTLIMNDFNHECGQYFSVGNAQIYVEETGESSGFPVVFLHGGLGSICDYSPFVEKIDRSFRCIGIDSRGHGKSTLGGETLSYELLENDIATILEQLNISKCAVVGFSDGGIIALRLAISKPHLITKLTGIGADWNHPDANLQKLFANLTTESWQKKFPESVELYEKLNPEANFEYLMKQVINMWLDLTSSGYPGKRIKSVQCQSLMIRGDSDPFLPLANCARIHEELPNSHFLNIPFSGHVAHVDQADIVGMLVNRFLSL